MKKSFLVSILALISYSAGAFVSDNDNLIFKRIPVALEFQSSETTGIVQDKYGFLWFATGSGLIRYDGVNAIDAGASRRGLFESSIECLVATDDGILLGSKYGLYSVDPQTLDITRLDTNGNNSIRCILIGDNGDIWVGTETGLVMIGDGKITEYNTYTCGITHNIIRCLYEDSNGNLWIGTHDGLNVMDKEGNFKTLYTKKNDYKPELPNNLILTIKPYSDNDDSHLLIGTETGLVILDRNSGSLTTLNERNSSLSNEVIKCVFVSGEEVWMGTDFGLNVLNRATGIIKNYFHESLSPQTIPNNVVLSIFRDSGGTIWFATQGGSCYITEISSKFMLTPVYYEHNGIRISNSLRSICLSNSGSLYGSSDNGIIGVDIGKSKMLDLKKVNDRLLMSNTSGLLIDSYGRLWIATAGGLNIYNPADDSMKGYTTGNVAVFKTNYFAAMKDSGTGEIFLNVWGSGIYRVSERLGLDPETEIHPVTELTDDRFLVHDNKLWMIDRNRIITVNIINGLQTEIIDADKEYNRDIVKSLCMTADDILYVGLKGGIVKYDTVGGISTFIGLGNTGQESVINMVEDENGRVWGGTGSTLFVIDENGNAATIDLGNTFPMRSMHRGCMAISGEGIIYCGGDNGYFYFDTGSITIPTLDLPVYITTLWINNEIQSTGKQLPFVKEIKLQYNQRNLALGFASMQYGSYGSNGYYYKMEGVDNDWIYSGGGNRAVYSNLPPGKYEFMVRGTDNYGRMSGRTASLAIRIYPPFMLRKVFIFLYVMLGMTIIVALYRFSTKRIHLLNELRLARLEVAHEKEMNKVKIQFFTNISHEFRTPLSLIIPPLKEAVDFPMKNDKQKQLINIAYNNSEKLLKLINQLLDFRKMEEDASLNIRAVDVMEIVRRNFELFEDTAERMNIHFRLSSFSDEAIVNCDAEKIETVIYNLLSNAFKYTHGNGEVSVDVSIRNDGNETGLVIAVSDNGIGIKPKEINNIFKSFYRSKDVEQDTVGSGIGLAVVNRYVELHNGVIRVDSTPGVGSCFQIVLPADESLIAVKNPGTIGALPKVTVDNIDTLTMKQNVPTIVYVEDNPGMIEYIRLFLSGRYNIITANDGKKGFEKALEYNPDVIISDIMMPGTDGLTMSRMIKDDPRTRHIPIIILSAKSLEQDQLDGFRAGVDIYLIKPVHPEILEANIEQLISRNLKLIDYFRNKLVVVNGSDGGHRDADRKLIDDMIGLIENNISEPTLSVEYISREIGISSVHLYRRVKKLTGLSPNEFIRKYRLKKASLLIKDNKGNISEIMYYVGFSSSSYFSKCFKMEFGMPPSEYKENPLKLIL